MRMLPVVWRELGAIARRRSAYWIRSGVGLAAFLAMVWVTLATLRLPLTDQGRSLFQVLGFGGFAFALVAGIRGTSDALSEEKREGTLGLLFLTDLKGYDVVFGKFVSLSINSVYGILALVPLLAFAFILGGISPLQFFLMSACLLNTLFFSLAVGIFVSTFSQHERQAMGATLAIIFVLSIAPYAIAAAHTFESLEIWEALLPGFLIPSPIYAFSLAYDQNLSIFLRDEILQSIAFTHLAGWLCLIVASASIAARAHQETSRGRILNFLHNLRLQLAYGKAQHRRALRAQTLDRNAFSWLAGRDRLKSRYAWTFISLIGGLWAIARWKAADVMTDWPVTLGILWFVHLFFKVWIASEVSARFIEDRRTNALELLLTTPLSIRDFARGQLLALFRQFAGAVLAVLALDLLAAYHAGGSFGYALQSNSPWQYYLAGIAIFLADIYAMFWVAIWRSLHLRGANRTILQAIFLVILVPLGGLFLISRGSWIFSIIFGTKELTNAVLLWNWTLFCLVYDAILIAIARNAFVRDFREIASQPFGESAAKSAKADAPKSIPRGRRFRPIRWATAGAAIILCLIALAALRRNRLHHQVEQQFAAIRAAGLPVTPAEASARRPLPAQSEDADVLFNQVQHVFYPPQRGETSRLESTPLSASAKADAEAYLKKNSAALKLLDDLPNRKPVFHMAGPRLGVPVAPERLLQLLELRALIDLENGSPEAGRSITIVAHFARVMDGEFFAAQNIGRQALQIVSDLLERAPASGRFDAAQWREWQAILKQIDPLKKLQATLIMHRVEGIEIFNWPPDMLWQNFGRMSSSFPAVYSVSLAVRNFVGQDQRELLDFLDLMNTAIKDCQKPYSERPYNHYTHPWTSIGVAFAGSTAILPHLMPATTWLRRTAFTRLARLRLMQVAADIEIYRAEHGALPRTLTGIGANNLIDPFDSQPLRYIPNGDAYVLYSVGEDLKDNGGQRTSARNSGDIVFTSAPVAAPGKQLKPSL
jgi:ABC-type transport system involved in multi-copper enzyme maturation permease subunit